MASVFKRTGRKGKGKGKYLLSYVDHRGLRHTRSAKTTDQDAARRIASKLEADAALRRDGVIDPRIESIGQQARRTIEEHLADFRAKLSAAGSSEDHRTRTCRFISDGAEACEFETAGDIAADKVNHYATELLKSMAARSVAARLTALKSFSRWLAVQGKLPADPLASVRKPSVKTDRRKVRRMLLPEEWTWLRTVTLSGNVVRSDIPAVERVLLYAVAIQTGLRSNELRSLTRGSLFLDAAQPYVTCKAGSTKNQQDARQYIKPELVAELRRHIARKAPGAAVFSLPRREDVAAMLRADLAAARSEWLKAARRDPEERQRREQSDFLLPVNHEKEVFDFHSLRHTCGAWLAMSGAHPKAVQAVMRHSIITLTMDTYGHLFPGQEADTVARLPDLMSDPQPEAVRATGTYDQTAQPPAGRAAHAQRAEGGNRQNVAKRGERIRRDADEQSEETTCHNLLPVPTLGEHWQEVATAGNSSRGGTRTRTPCNGHGILNPERLPFRHSAKRVTLQ